MTYCLEGSCSTPQNYGFKNSSIFLGVLLEQQAAVNSSGATG